MYTYINNGIIDFLTLVVKAEKFGDYDYSENQIQFVFMAIAGEYVEGVVIEHEYLDNTKRVFYILEKPGEVIRLSQKGIDFLSKGNGGNIMNHKKRMDILKTILTSLYDGNKLNQINFDEFTQQNYYEVLDWGQESSYVRGIEINKGGPGNSVIGMVSHKAELTEKGVQLVEGELDKVVSTQSINQTFNFDGPVNGSTFGTNSTINNNFSDAIKQLKSYVSELPDDERVIGEELIEITSNTVVKPGAFKRFTSFLENHPKVVGYLGHSLVWLFANKD